MRKWIYLTNTWITDRGQTPTHRRFADIGYKHWFLWI
jgi:hypothetical protein